MKKTIFSHLSMLLFFGTLSWALQAQVYQFVSTDQGMSYQHRILMDDTYLIETVFKSDPPEFIYTRGGFYSRKNEAIKVRFEFNSNVKNDGLKEQSYRPNASWNVISKETLALEGKWLMGGRVTEDGEQRRDLTRPRKTMKMLLNGFFQWTAFNTETLEFFGAGGGTYTATKGNYVESIDYFSRDNSRVGKKLSFSFNQNEKDWYHKGFSSKGNPMHEIWTSRPIE
ncbi:MAG: hypothetical protein ACPGVF_00345 [Flavobacteriaceae bacterium]